MFVLAWCELSAQAVYQDANRNGRFNRSTERRRVLRPSGCMHFHPQHNHWHVDASARRHHLPVAGGRPS